MLMGVISIFVRQMLFKELKLKIKMMLLIRQNCGQRKLFVATCFLFICLF